MTWGYFGSDVASVDIAGEPMAKFTDADADALRYCGGRGHVERNDTTGPSDYREGATMPGLTLGGVLNELMGEKAER